MIVTIKTFFQFFKRDWYRYKKELKPYIINLCIIRPILFSLSFGYILAYALFTSEQKLMCTMFLLGNIMHSILILNSTLALRLMFDLQSVKFVTYQITILHPRLLLLQRILFSTLFTSMLTLCFFPMSKLVLQSHFITTNAHWPSVVFIIFLGSLCLSCMCTLYSCILKSSSQIESLWMRLNIPLMILGGIWAPAHVIKSVAPAVYYLSRFNPVLYITEGLRRAVLASDQFFSIATCAMHLLAFSILFALLNFYFFKKRVDHI